jgi:hypothetical protein
VICMTFLIDCTHLAFTTEAAHYSRRPRRAGEGDILFRTSEGSLFIPISPGIRVFEGISPLFKLIHNYAFILDFTFDASFH